MPTMLREACSTVQRVWRRLPRLACAVLAALSFLPLGASELRAAGSGAGPTDAEVEAQLRQLETDGPSHAAGGHTELGPARRGNPAEAVLTIRVGLHYSYTAAGTYSEFASRDHPLVRLSNTAGAAQVVDLATGGQVAVLQPGGTFEVAHNGSQYTVAGPAGPLGSFGGPIQFRPTDESNRFRVESIRRSTTAVPQYYGAMEVARGSSTAAGKVNLVNVVPLEPYVRGVVVNESLASFHLEALKAQATAARGYAVSNIGRYVALGYPFDLLDSSASQVYRGATSEHPRGNQATDDTRGLVASHNGEIITAFYSSSMGGHTEDVEWIFNSPASQLPGTNRTPYLRGVYDGEGAPPSFSSEASLREFWTTPQAQTYDACDRAGNRFARWRLEIPAPTLKERLVPGRYQLVSGTADGPVTGVEVRQRMAASGRVGVVRVTLSGGELEVRGWDNLRRVFGTSVTSTPVICPNRPPVAPNFVLNNPSVIQPYPQPDGTFGGVITWGGGWGHNVGMSQFGAHGRAQAGQSFLQILKGYYTGVDIGSSPIEIGHQPPGGPPALRHEFVSPSGKGTLVIRPRGLRSLRVLFNDRQEVVLGAGELTGDVVRLDVTATLRAGVNTVQYIPAGRDGEATVLVIVE
ncbi:MAG TPA: SpoIID/LytB domain-containing protein [Chloroflexota bacterium]|nr:SpoIID/LytB domain-containing protein [Chloroflexota bacterium]